MLDKMSSCATGEHSNTEIRTVVLKKYNYIGEIISGRKYIPHSQSPLNVSVRMYIPHTHVAPRKTYPFTGTSHTIFPVKSFALLNVSPTVHRRNYVEKAVHHTQVLCGKRLRKVA